MEHLTKRLEDMNRDELIGLVYNLQESQKIQQLAIKTIVEANPVAAEQWIKTVDEFTRGSDLYHLLYVCLPLSDAANECSIQASGVMYSVFANAGVMPRETARDFARRLGDSLNRLDLQIEETNAKLREHSAQFKQEIAFQVDRTAFYAVRDALKRYEAGTIDYQAFFSELKAIGGNGPDLKQYIDWQVDHKPGPDRDPVRSMIGKRAVEIKKEKRLGYKYIVPIMIRELSQKEITMSLNATEKAALTLLRSGTQVMKYVSDAANDYKRRAY
jgi:hypothetical protein